MHYFIIGNSQQIAAEFRLTLVLAVFLTYVTTKVKVLRPKYGLRIFLDPVFVHEVKFSLKFGLRPNLSLRLLS